jgi:hypothetical protein
VRGDESCELGGEEIGDKAGEWPAERGRPGFFGFGGILGGGPGNVAATADVVELVLDVVSVAGSGAGDEGRWDAEAGKLGCGRLRRERLEPAVEVVELAFEVAPPPAADSPVAPKGDGGTGGRCVRVTIESLTMSIPPLPPLLLVLGLQLLMLLPRGGGRGGVGSRRDDELKLLGSDNASGGNFSRSPTPPPASAEPGVSSCEGTGDESSSTGRGRGFLNVRVLKSSLVAVSSHARDAALVARSPAFELTAKLTRGSSTIDCALCTTAG